MAKRGKSKARRRPQGHPSRVFARHREEEAKRLLRRHQETITRMAEERDMTVPEFLTAIPEASEGREGLEAWLREHPPVRGGTSDVNALSQEVWHKTDLAAMRDGSELDRAVAHRLDQTTTESLEKLVADGRMTRTPDGWVSTGLEYADALLEVQRSVPGGHLYPPERPTMKPVEFPAVDMQAVHDDCARVLTRPGDAPPPGQMHANIAVASPEAPELVGVIMDPEGESICGLVPNSAAEDWTQEHGVEALEREMGMPLGGPFLDAQIRAQAYGELRALLETRDPGSPLDNTVLTTTDLAAFAFPNALYEAEGELRDAVQQRLEGQVHEALGMLMGDGLVMREMGTTDRWKPGPRAGGGESPTGGASPALDMAAKLMAGGDPSEAMREAGYDPVIKNGDDSRLREILTAGGGPSVLMDMETGAVSGPRRSGTVGEAVHDALISGLRAVGKGWSLAPRGFSRDDVAVHAQGTRPLVRITGDLADAVSMAALVTDRDAGDWVREQLSRLVIAGEQRLEFQGASVQVVPQSDMGPVPPGDTPEARLHAVAVAKLVRERWPEGDEQGVALDAPEDLRLSYIGMANLSAHSLARGYGVRIEPADVRRIDPRGWVHVLFAWRVETEAHGTAVRLALSLPVREDWTGDRPTSVPIQAALHDVSPQTWEALSGEGPAISDKATLDDVVDPSQFARELERGVGERPTWAGARAFDRVWDRAELFARWADTSVEDGITVREAAQRDGYDADGGVWDWARAPVSGFALSTLEALETAHEVLVDPELVNAMPPSFDGGWETVTRYALDCGLPFASTFLDMEGPAGSCVVVKPVDWETSGLVLAIRGAHVERGDDGSLEVMPYGALTREGDVDREKTYNPLGRFTFGRNARREGASGVWAQTAIHRNGFVDQHVSADPAAITSPLPMPHGQNEPGEQGAWGIESELPAPGSGCLAATPYDATVEIDMGNLGVQVATLTAGAMAALRALYLYGMGNVELVSGVSRQVRRAAERKGVHQIALAVHVSVNRKHYVRQRDGEDGERRHREFSHRFQRAGSTAHYPVGTRMADSRPDLCVACPRCGRCRRILRPSTIIGPDDKPLILKSLVIDQ